MLKNLVEDEREILSAKFIAVSCQRALVIESGTLRTQLGGHTNSEDGCSAWDALYDTTL
jgi:predicted alpha/beta hydrolase family esterase